MPRPCVSFSISSLAYRVSALELPGQSHHIQVDFEDGEHVFTSPDFNLGTINTLGGHILVGRFSFRYSYDSTDGVITVCGTDYPSAHGMTLITMPEGTDQACLEHAAQSGFMADEAYGKAMWNYNTQLMPGAAQVFKGIARDANDTLIRALVAHPHLVVQVRETLSRLPLKDYLDLCVVYRDGTFLAIYDPNRQYTSSDQVRPFESVFGGIVTMNKDTKFANVIGSTNDPKINKLAWIRLWELYMGFYPGACTSLYYKGFDCGDDLKGGHVIFGKTAERVAKGTSQKVFIMPICGKHNSTDSVYMAALTYTQGIWLDNYMGN